MSWQVRYALKNIQQGHKEVSAEQISDDAIRIAKPNVPYAIAVISAEYLITPGIATQYHSTYPAMDFLCGYRKECAWEGGAINFLEARSIGWGSAGTLESAIPAWAFQNAAHKTYFFSYRLISQLRSISNLNREFDRVFTMTLADGRVMRVGMIMEYEPTADAIRSFWDRFGPIDIAWNINPNGNPTLNAIEAGRNLGCEVMKWDELREKLRSR